MPIPLSRSTLTAMESLLPSAKRGPLGGDATFRAHAAAACWRSLEDGIEVLVGSLGEQAVKSMEDRSRFGSVPHTGQQLFRELGIDEEELPILVDQQKALNKALARGDV